MERLSRSGAPGLRGAPGREPRRAHRHRLRRHRRGADPEVGVIGGAGRVDAALSAGLRCEAALELHGMEMLLAHLFPCQLAPCVREGIPLARVRIPVRALLVEQLLLEPADLLLERMQLAVLQALELLLRLLLQRLLLLAALGLLAPLRCGQRRRSARRPGRSACR
eukprot:TRINITY_DN1180_c0_g1_i9.p2 TRINITY_DN1180_c0_g1~~TRINITY_DN1180_c0_g1_i9.p2  ORF type:complete len:166 (-),score=9.74 TRINITY_DN1180_c0_g1_i9:420-917(-)